jgi:hypothetical protein
VANLATGPKAEDVPEREVQKPHTAVERTNAAPRYRNASLGRGGVSRKASQTNEEVAEIATDFIPLTHAGSLAPEDGGQVMRVELPRSALVSFGLAMNVEREGERIKADVLVGEDGVARAIRFVR